MGERALPRGHKVKPLVAEFGTYMKVFADPQKPKDLDKLLATLPKGAKPVSRHIVTGGDLQADRQDATAVFLDVDDNSTVEKIHIGIPSEPDDFVQRAIAAGHPRSLEQHLDPQVKSMIHANFVADPSIVAKKRADFFRKYVKRASELSRQEEELRSKMPQHVLELVGNKRWCYGRRSSMTTDTQMST